MYKTKSLRLWNSKYWDYASCCLPGIYSFEIVTSEILEMSHIRRHMVLEDSVKQMQSFLTHLQCYLNDV